MRAYAVQTLGEPGSVIELPRPDQGDDEVLVRIQAAGLNAFDAAVVNGYAKDYMEHRFPLIPGSDASGVVEDAGGSDLSIGDEVVVRASKPFQGAGTLAEFVSVTPDSLARKPASVSHTAAATAPLAGLTALAAIEALDPRSGQVIVVLGATGGVGSYAIQLAARRGARVVAVTRGENADYARELGAADVIDYSAGDVAEEARRRYPGGIDGVLDFAGQKDLVDSISSVVRSGGRVVSTTGSADAEQLAERGLKAVQANAAPTERLHEVLDLIASGDIRTPAITIRPLAESADAFGEQSGGHVRGKLVLIVSE